MKSYVLPLLAGSILLFSACKKNDETPGSCSVLSPSSLEYIPLQVGNYWIYDWHFIRSTGVSDGFRFTDTVSVAGLTTIAGKAFFRIERSHGLSEPVTLFRRDSLGYLIDENGRIDFTAENLGTVFSIDSLGPREDRLLTVETSVQKDLVEIETPAGNFFCLDKTGEIKFINEEEMDKNKLMNTFIAPGLGEVRGTEHFVNGDGFFEYFLVEYHLE